MPLPAVPAAAAAAAAPGTLEGPERGGGDGVLIKRGCPIDARKRFQLFPLGSTCAENRQRGSRGSPAVWVWASGGESVGEGSNMTVAGV